MKQAPVVMTDAVIEKLEVDSIGTGTSPNYKPVIEVRKTSSRGRSRRASRKKTRRNELLSDVKHNLFLALERCPDVLDTPWHQGDLNRATPYGVRIESYQSNLQIHDRERNPIGSPFVCVATYLASGIIVATQRQLRPPDTTAMEYFCTTVLDKLKPAPAGVWFHVDRSEGIDWNHIGMKLRLSISSSAMSRYSATGLSELQNRVRTRTPR
jgi:hypothetical protein